MRVVVTAGPTREYIDPVRFLSNPSTGKMGFAVARAAAERGWDVTLVAGPVALKTPKGVKRVDVTSARDMLRAVKDALADASKDDVFIATAAVADWRPGKCAKSKLKKREMVDNFVDRSIDRKLTEVLKNVVTLDRKQISLDDFNKSMQAV